METIISILTKRVTILIESLLMLALRESRYASVLDIARNIPQVKIKIGAISI
jgi:hypothetical protein